MALTKPVNLECKDLHGYLKSRPLDVLERLYDYPTICLAVYRLVCIHNTQIQHITT